MSRGSPSAIFSPKSITTSRSTSPMTKSMSCSTSRMLIPSARRPRSSPASACFSWKRSPAADAPLLAGRQAGRRLGEVGGEADPLYLECSLMQQAPLFVLIHAQHRGNGPLPAAQMRPDGDVLEHRHAADQIDLLEGAR